MFAFLTSGKVGPVIVSTLVISGFIIVLVLLIVKPIAIDATIADILKILVGSLSAKFGDVVQFHIGSSAGSRDKDSVLKGLVGTTEAGK